MKGLKSFLKHLTIMMAPLFTCVLLAQDPAYTGNKKCRVCHLKEYQSWSQSKMAKAFELLKAGVAAEAKTKSKMDPAKDYTTDASCLPCHTTGYGKPGGFVDSSKTPDFVGVGCEMCHGPGSNYVKPEFMSLANNDYKRADLVKVGLVAVVGKDQCAVCHNGKSPHFKAFKFEERMLQATHAKVPLKFDH